MLTDNKGLQAPASGTFRCTPSDAAVAVRRSPTDPFGWVQADGRPYFPIGLQDCWNLQAPDLTEIIDGEGRNDGSGRQVTFDDYLATYGQAGFNLFRFSQNNCSYPLYTDLEHYSEAASQATDRLLASARQHGLRVMFGFFGSYQNPRHAIDSATALNLLPTTPREERFLRYCVARWGVYTDFWELLNESDASPAWSTLMADYVRSIDPDRKPVTSSAQSAQTQIAGTDFVDAHWYESEDELTSDTRTAQQASLWKLAGLPVIVGEQGNTGMNWDAGSATRMRIRAWTALFQQIGLVFWNTSWSRAGMNGGSYSPGAASNIYLGPEERGYVHALKAFTDRLDAGMHPASVSTSGPASIHAYGLASTQLEAVYLHHAENHTASASGRLLLSLPDTGNAGSFVGHWIDPATGNQLGTVVLAEGQQNIDIPPFVVDLALLATQEAN
jgi:hypothetical protein